MQFPLQLRFKVLALATQIYVTDASGNTVFYVKQKMFKLKEDIAVFADDSQKDQRYTIKADRVIDFSAAYNFTDGRGGTLGSIKRKGVRSLWKASYDIRDGNDNVVLTVAEENPWAKVVESLTSNIPVVGFVVNYLVNPIYAVSMPNGNVAYRLKKRPSLFERAFELEQVTPLGKDDEARAVLGLLMMVLLERARG